MPRPRSTYNRKLEKNVEMRVEFIAGVVYDMLRKYFRSIQWHGIWMLVACSSCFDGEIEGNQK